MTLKSLGAVCVSLVFLVCCTSKKTGKADGWYHISENTDDSVAVKPFVTVKDFEYIELDSVEIEGNTVYQITGKLKDTKACIFADETEKAIEKKIGFLYQGKLLCSPSPNCRIENGHFAITPPFWDQKEDMWSLFHSLKTEM